MLNDAMAQRSLQRGFTMLEVLVSIIILVFGLLGLVGLQSKMQLLETESYQRAQALLLLTAMGDRINANRDNALGYITGTSTPLGTGDSQPTTCATITPLADRDKCEWSNALKGAAEKKATANVGAMIGARGCIEQVRGADTTAGVCSPAIYRVTVAWQGLNPTSAPPLLCGSAAYGDVKLQRVVSAPVIVGLLKCQ
jgi:type IV pilus assembly protein PilV